MTSLNLKSLNMTSLAGHLEHITYFNAENHYTIAKFRTEKINNLVTIIGYLPCVNPGEALEIKGSWETNPRYGEQFRIESFEVTLPATVDGIRKYLKSGLIKGIGSALVESLVSRFGEHTLDIIETKPGRLFEIDGIGKKKAAIINRAWKEHHAIRSLMIFLGEHGLNASLSARILKEYGRDAEDFIRKNPYCMATEIDGIDFHAADAMAIKLGIPANAPERIKASILYFIEGAIKNGDVFVFDDKLIRGCNKLTSVETGLINAGMAELAESGDIVIDETIKDHDCRAVYSKTIYQAEKGVAEKLKALLSVPVIFQDIGQERITAEALKRLAINLSPDQLAVIEEIIAHKIAVITGGPGTGKTTLIRAITTVFEILGKKILLAAPTGRAARRLSEVAGKKAATIHKMLGCNQLDECFEKNRDNPLEADVLIIDEASMVDIVLMFHLLDAIPLTSALIMVGDVFQLPSIGPGNVLSDIIKSGIIKTFELKKIFRQARESRIIINAHKIRNGKQPDLKAAGGHSEFYFIEKKNPDSVVETILELCTKRIPEKFNLDRLEGIQVITPMHKGKAGTINLNQALQQALNNNPLSAGTVFKAGDKVMHLKNNYQKDVFNGDIGIVDSIDKGQKRVFVKYYERIVEYDFTELDELTLSYAISVHKSQGSEYPAVIIPLMTSHYPMLQRNLVYTAITRGKILVIIVGMKKALEIALKNNRPTERLSSLNKRLIL